MKKNAQLHILIETRLISQLKKEAEENKVGFSEWCRKKLRKDSQLDRIEKKIDRIINGNHKKKHILKI